METIKKKYAFLVYDSWKQGRNKNKSFEGKINIGVYLLIHICKQKSINIDFCSVDSARKYDVILVSFTSNYDMLAYYKQVAKHEDWQPKKRKFIILGGGFGMQNPMAIRDYLTFAWFGRADDEIVKLLKYIPDYKHESLMDLKNIKKCKINQAKKLYQDELILRETQKNKFIWKEYMLGCPNKCFYCHYTWSRKNIKTNKQFYTKVINNSLEIDPFNKSMYNGQTNKLIIGLDGLTEKVRYYVNRKLSDERLIDLIININNKSKKEWAAQIIQFYNIVGFEIENGNEMDIFKEILYKIDKKIKNPLKIILQTTPLHSSPVTPIQFAKLNINTKNNKNASKIIFTGNKIEAKHSPFLESDWSVIEGAVIERATDNTQNILNDIVFNTKLRKLKTEDKIKAIQYKYDINDLIREYNVEERLPTWFLESYTSNEKIKKMRLQMKAKLIK